MKPLKKQLQPITLLLVIVMVIQSCTVYKSSVITLDQAVQNGTKVNVITKNEDYLIFNRIDVENGNYYGIKKSKDEMVRTPLNEENIYSIKEKNEALSTILTIAIPLLVVVGIIIATAGSISPDISF